MSAAGVSGAVGYLEQLGMLRRERERGSRRDVYVIEDDAWHDAMMRHDQLYGDRGSLEHALTARPDAPAHRGCADREPAGSARERGELGQALSVAEPDLAAPRRDRLLEHPRLGPARQPAGPPSCAEPGSASTSSTAAWSPPVTTVERSRQIAAWSAAAS